MSDDSTYSRAHCFGGREKVASQPRYNRDGDMYWNTLPSLIGYTSQIVPVAVANTSLLPGVTMIFGSFGSFSFL